jgi:hypothetical protein
MAEGDSRELFSHHRFPLWRLMTVLLGGVTLIASEVPKKG